MAEVKAGAELTRPEHHVKETSDDSPSDFFFDPLKASTAAKELFKAEGLVVRDDVVVSENH